jgi:hypothetical protein
VDPTAGWQPSPTFRDFFPFNQLSKVTRLLSGLGSYSRVAAITSLYKGSYTFTQPSKVTRSGLGSYNRVAAITSLYKGFFPITQLSKTRRQILGLYLTSG